MGLVLDEGVEDLAEDGRALASVSAAPFAAVLALLLLVGATLYSGRPWSVPTVPWLAASYSPVLEPSTAATATPPTETAAFARVADPVLDADAPVSSSRGGITRVRSGAGPPPIPSASPAPARAPSELPAPPIGAFFRVANTDGSGAFLRRTPRLVDRLVAWPDATLLESLGEAAEGDELAWLKVRDPGGNVGCIPARYAVR